MLDAHTDTHHKAPSQTLPQKSRTHAVDMHTLKAPLALQAPSTLQIRAATQHNACNQPHKTTLIAAVHFSPMQLEQRAHAFRPLLTT